MLLHVHFPVSRLLLLPLVVFCLLLDHSSPFIDLAFLRYWVVPLLVLVQVLNVFLLVFIRLLDAVTVELEGVGLPLSAAIRTYLLSHVVIK